MYELGDTIAAISSGSSQGPKAIIRVSGSQAVAAVNRIFSPAVDSDKRKIYSGCIEVDSIRLEAFAYVFPQERSYTGDLLIELSVYCSEPVAELIINEITMLYARLAGPGEFTARAYLNGKIDLSQAEAVAEVVSSSNNYQLQAAEKLLQGTLSSKVEEVRGSLLDVMSLIEAEMDFCDEGVMFVSIDQAVAQIDAISSSLVSLLNENIAYQAMISLASVGIAGSPNAGKSSLLNSMLGEQRSIVSSQRATTRDILTSQLSLQNNDCVIFDCAGLSIEDKVDVIDEIAQLAAIEAINAASLIIFCVDLCSEDISEDIKLLSLIRNDNLIFTATKADQVYDSGLTEKLEMLRRHFGQDFLPTSSVSGSGVNKLKSQINDKLMKMQGKLGDNSLRIAVNKRHRDSVAGSLDNLAIAKDELSAGNYEITAMLLRQAYESLADIGQQQSIDEMMLDRIFSKFCIGK